MEEKRNARGVLVGNLRDRDHFEDPRADWTTLKKKKKRTELLAQDRNSRFCGHGYERFWVP